MGRALKAARRDGNNVLRVGVLTLAMSAAITALSFVLLEDLYLNRYWIPLMTLGAPVMAACLSRKNNAPLRNVCVLLFAGVVVVSSAMQIGRIDEKSGDHVGSAGTGGPFAEQRADVWLCDVLECERRPRN